MVEIDIRYEGGLRCSATHGPSGQVLSTDAPVDNQGRGESFSPTDLVATATGTCMATMMGIVASRHDWDLSGMRVRVGKEMTTVAPRRILRLSVVIDMPTGLPQSARPILENAASTCPVNLSLSPAIEVPVEFRWA